MHRKAIALMSGGLDSTVAVKLMLEQGIDVLALNFKSPFCVCDGRQAGGCKSHAKRAAEQMGIEIRTVHKGLDYIDVVRSPKYGYGSGINPCVDCRIFTFKSAKKYMEESGASFIITGEVLGQRPMSQRRDPMFLIERESGLEGLILRPLSAKLLPETLPEKAGIVDRGKLMAIGGRSRKEQIKMADGFKIEDYPCASGGCLLTDKNFAVKLRDAFDHKAHLDWKDIQMLMLGRHFRLGDGARAVVGRNEDENRRINKLSGCGSLFTPSDFPGPTVYVDRDYDENVANMAGPLLLSFSKHEGDDFAEINYSSNKISGSFMINGSYSDDDINRMWLR